MSVKVDCPGWCSLEKDCNWCGCSVLCCVVVVYAWCGSGVWCGSDVLCDSGVWCGSGVIVVYGVVVVYHCMV